MNRWDTSLENNGSGDIVGKKAVAGLLQQACTVSRFFLLKEGWERNLEYLTARGIMFQELTLHADDIPHYLH